MKEKGHMMIYKENKEFRILSAIGMILVVAGHLGYGLFEIGDLFPYYSFHVFIFVFVSGYFYKPEKAQNAGSYILGKCLSLLLPYFIWNLIYGIFTQIMRGLGFFIGNEITLKTLFFSPFLDGHQFSYNYPAWFVPALFLVEAANVLLRKVLALIKLENEWLIFAGCLLAGIFTVFLAQGGHVWGYYAIAGRVLFLLPGFQMGRIYREKLEKYDTLSDGVYLFLVIIIQVLVNVLCKGLAFSAVWVNGFVNNPVIPYVTVCTGIAFWLRIAKIIGKLPYAADKLVYVGRNTYSVMLHHITAFMLPKGIFYLVSLLTPLCGEFDKELFLCDVNYVYLPGGAEAAKWIYLLVGIGVPLFIAKGQEFLVKKMKGLCKRKDLTA